MKKSKTIEPASAGFWNKAQARKFLKVSDRTLSRLMARGAVPYYKLGHSTVRFKQADLMAQLDQSSRVVNSVRARLRR